MLCPFFLTCIGACDRDSVLQAEFGEEYVQLAGIINELLQQHRLVMGTDAAGMEVEEEDGGGERKREGRGPD
jgi:hypothetical protein